NAAEAIAVIDRGHRVDLLFTDIVMPGAMNGRQLADELTKRRPSIKILYTSGYAQDVILHDGSLAPDVLVLPKPFRKTDLDLMVRRALEGDPLPARHASVA